MNAIAKPEPTQELQTQDNVAPMLAMIERAARDPNVDVSKMEKLWAMKEHADAIHAKQAYDAAMASLQTELPDIPERGKAIVNGQVRYTFALWEDINAAIKPILSKHGFALTFRIIPGEKISVTGVLSHKDGHREETSISLPADTSGSKNAVQAVASSTSYGKRYTAGALLNLTSHGEDDDAFSAVKQEVEPSWFNALQAAADETELRKQKAEMVTTWGKATAIPKELVAAYNARLDALRAAAKAAQ
ncbi:MAG TPA: ERF family protein [Candidatus Acidoferrales bacterium]|nr:ERF family protein [Candidatus Acidoferrales bacterium]